jgi:hypothetical protein
MARKAKRWIQYPLMYRTIYEHFLFSEDDVKLVVTPREAVNIYRMFSAFRGAFFEQKGLSLLLSMNVGDGERTEKMMDFHDRLDRLVLHGHKLEDGTHELIWTVNDPLMARLNEAMKKEQA